jgi:hypothetical protein
VVGVVEQGTSVADAAALDVVDPRRPTRQHSRLAALDDGPVECARRGCRRATDTQKQPAVPTKQSALIGGRPGS